MQCLLLASPLGIMSDRLILVELVSVFHCFLLLNIVWLYHVLFTHSPNNGHLDYILFLAFRNNGTVDIHA